MATLGLQFTAAGGCLLLSLGFSCLYPLTTSLNLAPNAEHFLLQSFALLINISIHRFIKPILNVSYYVGFQNIDEKSQDYLIVTHIMFSPRDKAHMSAPWETLHFQVSAWSNFFDTVNSKPCCHISDRKPRVSYLTSLLALCLFQT